MHGWHTALLGICLTLALGVGALPPAPLSSAALASAPDPAVSSGAPLTSRALVEPPVPKRPLIGSFPAPLALSRPAAPTVGGEASVLPQESDQATLEVRQPDVQFSPAGAASWQTVPTQQSVRSGDRVRTGSGASARLVYFEGTTTEIGPETGVIVQRLERTPDGGIIGSLYQAVGTTVSRVVQIVDPSARFEVETPAATAFVRGTMPQVIVGADGATQINNVPDNTGGTVSVQGKDPNASQVSLGPGQSTRITPGQPPLPPTAMNLSLNLGSQQTVAGSALDTQAGATDRQQQRQQQQQQARQAVAQAQVGLAAAAAELARLTQQEQQLVQSIVAMLTPTVVPQAIATPTRAPSPVPTVPIGQPSLTPPPTVIPPPPTVIPPPTLSPPATIVPPTCPGGVPPPGQIGPPPSAHGIFTTTTGVAPNRTFIVEWRVEHFTDSANTANFEAQLEEGTNRIYFVYNASVDAGASATSGIQQGTGTTAIQVSCDQPVLTNGRAIQFAPGNPVAPIPPNTAAPCPGTDAFGYACSNTSRPFVAGTVDVGNHCDDCVTTGVPLPFSFVYYGQAFSQVNVSSNGNLQFASASTRFSENGLPDSSFNQTIFVMWDDWVTSGFSDARGSALPRDCRRLQSPKCGALSPFR